MTTGYTKNEIFKWMEVLYNPDPDLRSDLYENQSKYLALFIEKIAEYLYEDMKRARTLITSPFSFSNEFETLKDYEKAVWYKYASGIPEKLKSLNLFIRPFKDFCGTCIITDKEIEKLASLDHSIFLSETYVAGSGVRKSFFRELNYLIPPQLKKIGKLQGQSIHDICKR
jgi:hypothetical protein